MLPDPKNDRGTLIGSHVLLVSPLTFSYHETICDALRSSGHQVTWWNDRAGTGVLYKLALRVFPRITKYLSEGRYLQLLSRLDRSVITDVLVIKGEGLSRSVIDAIRNALPQASMGLYLWDGAENVPGVLRLAEVFDSVSTFDPHDAATRGWFFRPLFARQIAAATKRAGTPRFDWCFVGTLHSDRHRVITALRKRTPPGRSFVFGYLPGRLVYGLRHLVDWTLWSAPKGSLSMRSMSAQEVASIVATSTAVLDVEHPRQRGLTMRTIETLLAGKKLVTTNTLVKESDLFHPSRVQMIDRGQPTIAEEFVNEPFLPVPEDLAAKYSCAAWIQQLLAYQRQGRLSSRAPEPCAAQRAPQAACTPQT
jgi:hypothetical protein